MAPHPSDDRGHMTGQQSLAHYMELMEPLQALSWYHSNTKYLQRLIKHLQPLLSPSLSAKLPDSCMHFTLGKLLDTAVNPRLHKSCRRSQLVAELEQACSSSAVLKQITSRLPDRPSSVHSALPTRTAGLGQQLVALSDQHSMTEQQQVAPV